MVFGLETAGTSLLWCGIVADGYFSGKHLGDYGQNKGDALYETIHK